jgi:diguanylate cyclase (GGDEF)-like protein
MDYRQQLSNFATRVHKTFGLREQGRELVAFVVKTMHSERACLLFVDMDGEDFLALSCIPAPEDNALSRLSLNKHDSIVEYLNRERKPLTRESLASLSDSGRQQQYAAEIALEEIELFVPIVSRDQLIGILVLGRKQSGRYTLEDFALLEDVANRVAISIEKEYLREQLVRREEKLSLLNRCQVIMTSSMDMPEVFKSFVEELKTVVDIDRAAITLISDTDLSFLALYPDKALGRKVGERVPLRGTATEWVATHRKIMAESNLRQRRRFVEVASDLKQGIRSVVCLPLIVKDRTIGSLVLASRHPNVYHRIDVRFLEQLASRIATPIESSGLFAIAKEKSRTDELTGLYNRRFVNEVMASEINRHTRYGGAFSLVILDVDSLKSINDKYGHLAGDNLLHDIGGILKKTIRLSDYAFRYGGDEFAILLPNTSIESALPVAERIRKQLASSVTAGHVSVTASFGLASWPANGTTANEVIAAADAALYQAKRSGSNQSRSAGDS